MEDRRYRSEESHPRGGVRRRTRSRYEGSKEGGEQGVYRRVHGENLPRARANQRTVRRTRSETSNYNTSYPENHLYYTRSHVDSPSSSETENEEFPYPDKSTTDSQIGMRTVRPRERRVVARERSISRPRRTFSPQTSSTSPGNQGRQSRQNLTYNSTTREESGTERGRTRRRSSRRRPRQNMHTTDPLADQIALAVQKLGLGANRKHPEPDKFKIESSESFSQFVGDFERYCYHAISENTEDWRKQLKHYLRGEMLEVYYDIRKGKQTYEEIIRGLTKYYKQRRGSIKVDHKTEFHKADWKEGESVHRYAVRLEGLAREAYGRRYERVLRKKFLETAPENFISLLTVYGCARSKKFGLTVEELDWEEIISLAAKEKRRIGNTVEEKKSRKDLKNRKVETTDESEEEEMEEARAAIATQIPVRERQRNESSSRFVPNITGKISAVRAGQCFRCGESGHFVANCPQAPTGCWTCGEYTHLARDCPTNWGQQQGRGQGYRSGGRIEQRNSNQVRYPQQGSDNQGDSGYGG